MMEIAPPAWGQMIDLPTRGAIFNVKKRDPQDEKRWAEGDDNLVNFPVGEDLVAEATRLASSERIRGGASTAIRRYIEAQGTTLRDVVHTLLNGEDFGPMTVERFLTNTGARPLFSPIVEDGLRLGLSRNAASWQDLIAKTVQVDRMQYEYYQFNNGTPAASGNPTGTGEFSTRRIPEGSYIPTASVTLSTKSYTLFKRGRGIEWTDEAKQAPIDLATMWFQNVGLQLSWDYHDEIVSALLNGYFGDGSDAAPVISSATAAVITDADLYTVQGTMQVQYGYTAKVMLMSLARAVNIRTMENGVGQRLFPNGVEAAGLPPIRISPTVPDDKIIFVDTDFAMMRLENKPFSTEFDRSVQTQVEGSYGTETSLTVPLFANARVILDS